jgi:ubiquinone biosynthesis protein UbiJ
LIDFSQPLPAASAHARPQAAPGTNPESGVTFTPPDLSGGVLVAVLAALNHLLAQQRWARERLRMFARRTLRVGIDPKSTFARFIPPLFAQVGEDGLLRPLSVPQPSSKPDVEPANLGAASPDNASPDAASPDARFLNQPHRAGFDPSAFSDASVHADVSLWLYPSWTAFSGALQGGVTALSRHLRVEGDVMFAATLGELAQHLRWDAEEDLSRIVGDIGARRIFAWGEHLRERIPQRLQALAQDVAEGLTVEKAVLAHAADHRAFAQSLDDLAQAIDRIEMQVRGLRAR